MLVRVCLVAAVLAAGCTAQVSAPSVPDGSSGSGSGSAVDPDGAHSGQRLKIVWYEFNDGTRTFDGTFFDTVRKEHCFLYDGWADGKAYCAPSKATSNVVYTDAGCTQKAVQVFVDQACPRQPPSS